MNWWALLSLTKSYRHLQLLHPPAIELVTIARMTMMMTLHRIFKEQLSVFSASWQQIPLHNFLSIALICFSFGVFQRYACLIGGWLKQRRTFMARDLLLLDSHLESKFSRTIFSLFYPCWCHFCVYFLVDIVLILFCTLGIWKAKPAGVIEIVVLCYYCIILYFHFLRTNFIFISAIGCKQCVYLPLHPLLRDLMFSLLRQLTESALSLKVS